SHKCRREKSRSQPRHQRCFSRALARCALRNFPKLFVGWRGKNEMSANRIAAFVALVLLLSAKSWAGGPLIIAGDAFSAIVQGQPIVWNTSTPVKYRTPDLGGLGRLDNATAVARVQSLFQVWQDVKTASISFQREGAILHVGAYTGGAVDTAAKFNQIDG